MTHIVMPDDLYVLMTYFMASAMCSFSTCTQVQFTYKRKRHAHL
jgi:hypothetical protein